MKSDIVLLVTDKCQYSKLIDKAVMNPVQRVEMEGATLALQTFGPTEIFDRLVVGK